MHTVIVVFDADDDDDDDGLNVTGTDDDFDFDVIFFYHIIFVDDDYALSKSLFIYR